jgi:hypothetical protein
MNKTDNNPCLLGATLEGRRRDRDQPVKHPGHHLLRALEKELALLMRTRTVFMSHQ